MQLARSFVRASRPPRLRSMLEFAEQEIIIPDGPHKGDRFRAHRQPFSQIFFEEVDSGRWIRITATGPRQTGKTLITWLVPGLYHLFEVGETVICGVPSLDMAGDKWREDFLPMIEASRYRDLLPRVGAGSRGGAITSIKFRNGATLRFMTGGGDDKSRVGFTARVLLVTEADGLDTASGTSRESNPIDQMRKCLAAFGANAREYIECTVSIESGYIWQEIINGSDSRLILPCPHCGAWVRPEREHLMGWQEAEDAIAAEAAHLVCPDCKEPWTEEERIAANRAVRILHKGQSVDPKGNIIGDLPRTRTLGFRWTAANNLLAPMSLVGAEEWAASRAIDAENAEKKMRQFVWALPVEADDAEVVALSVTEVRRRMSNTPQGMVPAWADVITMGVDARQHELHWTLLAGDMARKRHVQIVDYGIQEVRSRQHPVEIALGLAMAELATRADSNDRGWPDENGEVRHPDLTFYDSGWKPVPVYQHCRNAGPRHWPVKGMGLDQYAGQRYKRPKTTGTTVAMIYDGFHLAHIKHAQLGTVQLYEFDADRAKSRVHDRLGLPIDEPGAMLLPRVDRDAEHTTFAKHLLAEQLVEVEGLQKWQKTPGHGGHNHWFDATGMALLAMFRRWSTPAPVQRARGPVITKPDGRPFLTR